MNGLQAGLQPSNGQSCFNRLSIRMFDPSSLNGLVLIRFAAVDAAMSKPKPKQSGKVRIAVHMQALIPMC